VRLIKGGAVIALAACLAATACSSGGRGARAGASPSATAMSDAHLQTLVNDLVACIRTHGAPGMPDVRVQNGHVIDPDENSVDQATKQNFQTALDACKAVEDRIPPAVLGKGDSSSERAGPTAADVPKLRQFAKCMRENGMPDWPDPKADGSFPMVPSLQTEGKSPRYIAAAQACKRYWDGSIRMTP
jgi:hypothetical protein